jgi:membrane dipeptidase
MKKTESKVGEDSMQTAKAWMRKHPVVDCLVTGEGGEKLVNDVIAGGINVISWSSGSGWRDTVKDVFGKMLTRKWVVERMPNKCALARSVAEIERARSEGKVAIVYNFQGAEFMEDYFHWLEVFWEFGLRILQPLYNRESRMGYGSLERNDMGLKHFGIEIVRYCNELGVLLDCSHAGERTSLDMIEMSEKPCIFSHSGAKALRDNLRNISDAQIKNCAAKGGVIGCPVFSDFVADTTGGHQPTPDDWVKHVDYVVKLVGIDHVGIGGDILAAPGGAVAWHNSFRRQFGETSGGMTFETHEVQGINHSHANFPLLIAALVKRGYKEEDVAKIMGGNWLRVYKAAWGA